MSLSYQSQVKEAAQNEGNLHETERIKTMIEQEDADVTLSPINLYHELKALTPSCEQHVLASPAFKSSSPKPQVQRFKTHLGFELQGSSFENEEELKPIHIMEENTTPNSYSTGSCKKKGEDHVMEEKITRDTSTLKEYPLPLPPLGDIEDNCVMGVDRIMGLASRTKGNISTTVTGKLSIETSTLRSEVKGIRGTQDEDEPEKAEKVMMDESRILVFVRLRPMTKGEKDLGAITCATVINRRDVCLTEPANENEYLGLKRLRGRHFKFDASFRDTASQQEVYSTTTAELVEAVLQGRNGSVFCYGATGAGKTYTMLGTTDNPGIMVLAIKDIFSKIRERSYDGNYAVHLSYLEVYNETVRDLLSLGRPLVLLREDKQGIVAAGLTQYRAYSTGEVMALLQKGNQNRTTEPNHVNESSSRSHAILQVVVGYQVRDQAMNVIHRVGKLSLIDLAGSERAYATDPKTLRAIEGANINRSLLSLSICINALVEGRKHIPYRDSKLTQLLKDSLGGSCNTVMIANISPSNLSFSETQNTLHWADRAKELRTKADEVNEYLLPLPESEADRDKLLNDLQKENFQLRVECARLQKKLSALRAKYMVANSSSPSSNTSPLASPTSTQPLKSPKPRASSLPGTCFTPEPKPEEADESIGMLRRTVKKELESEKTRMKNDHALQIEQKEEIIHMLSMKIENLSREPEAEIERIKNDHAVQLKQKEEIIHQLSMKIENQSGEREAEIEKIKNDHATQLEQKEEIIRQLSLKIENQSRDEEGENCIQRASLLPKELLIGDLKISGVQLLAPDLMAENRSIWDITTNKRSSIAILNGRDIRSHVANEHSAASPSMLLQLAYPCFLFVILFGLHVIGCTM